MILLLDENISPTVADELNRIGHTAYSFRNLGWLGISDEYWLPRAALMTDSLVLTCDLNIFRKQHQCSRIINNIVGIVFLTSVNESVENKRRLVISSWGILEALHDNTPRPFAWFLDTDGQLQDNLEGRRLSN